MAGSSNANEPPFLTVDVHFKGFFAPKPVVYFAPQKISLREVDFAKLRYRDFIKVLENVTKYRCKHVYYCLGCKSLKDGLRCLADDNDYVRFLDAANGNGGQASVYVDEIGEPVLEWAEDEKVEEGQSSASDDDDDKDSVHSDDGPVDHEPDDEEIHIVPSEDPFLNHISVYPKDDGDDASDDSGSRTKQLPKYPFHNSNQKWDTMVPILGMKFCNPQDLKYLVSNYVVANGYDLYYEKNDATRLLVRCCKDDGKPKCTFRLWATWMTNERSFQIKSLVNEHNCARTFKFGSIVTFKWIGKHFVSEILEDPKMSYRKMKEEVEKKFNIKVSVGQCRNAKRYALQEIEGSLIAHYAKLRSYGAELLRSNPGSTVTIDIDIMPDGTTVYFSRMYICLKGVKDGWIEGCRRVIGVDGCFLKGICRGELLSAVGRDANNQMYPIAWAVVAVENKATWKWFLELLLDDINMENGRGLTLISDQNKGLIESVKEVAPEAEHRQCARHIYANFRKKIDGAEYRKLFWMAAKATTPQRFQVVMNTIKDVDKEAFDHLMARDPKTWSRAFFEVGRCSDAMENGISESFNAAIVLPRKKPIISMLEEIRRFVMDRMYYQRMKGQKWKLFICPSIRRRIADMREYQRFWGVIPSGYMQFEVKSINNSYDVNLDERTCSCRGWQLTWVPCTHGIAALGFLNKNVEEYVALWFTTSMFGNCYRYTIKPLNGSDMWPKVDAFPILPPKRRRLPGRPTVNRRKDASERKDRHTVLKTGVVTKCSICNQPGHNKKGCPTVKTEPTRRNRKKKVVEEDLDDYDHFVEDKDADDNEDIEAVIEEHFRDGGDEPRDLDEEHDDYDAYDDCEDEAEDIPEDVPVDETVDDVAGGGTPVDVVGTEMDGAGSGMNVVEAGVAEGGTPLKRTRKISERITKLALKKMVVSKDGSGISVAKHVVIE